MATAEVAMATTLLPWTWKKFCMAEVKYASRFLLEHLEKRAVANWGLRCYQLYEFGSAHSKSWRPQEVVTWHFPRLFRGRPLQLLYWKPFFAQRWVLTKPNEALARQWNYDRPMKLRYCWNSAVRLFVPDVTAHKRVASDYYFPAGTLILLKTRSL